MEELDGRMAMVTGCVARIGLSLPRFWAVGVLLDDLVAADMRPKTLFEGDTEKRARLMGVLDEINGRFGKWTAVTASQGFKRE